MSLSKTLKTRNCYDVKYINIASKMWKGCWKVVYCSITLITTKKRLLFYVDIPCVLKIFISLLNYSDRWQRQRCVDFSLQFKLPDSTGVQNAGQRESGNRGRTEHVQLLGKGLHIPSASCWLVVSRASGRCTTSATMNNQEHGCGLLSSNPFWGSGRD